MSILDRIRTGPPRRADDVIDQATRAVHIINDQLAEVVRHLDRPTQPPKNEVEDYALRTLRRSILSARIALGRIPR